MKIYCKMSAAGFTIGRDNTDVSSAVSALIQMKRAVKRAGTTAADSVPPF